MAIYKEVIEKNYTVVGSPIITADYVASGFTSSSYVQMSIPTLTNSFIHISKMFAPATVSTSGRYPGSFSVNGSDTNWGLQPNSTNFLTACNILQGGTEVNRKTFSNTWVWVAIEVTTTGAVMRTLQDTDGDTYTLDTLPPLSDSAWNIDITFSNNLLSTFSNKTLYLGVNNYHSNSTANWQIDLKNTKYIADGVELIAVREERVDVSGSVEITKGYYSDGSNKINMPASTYNIDALTANQTLGGKNKLFAYTDSTDSVGALITSTTPTGSFKITKELEHPIYLDPTKNYIAGGELIEPALSFTSGTEEVWERPNLTSNTSYGTVSNVWGANHSGDYSAWKALDGDTSTYASLNDGSGGVVWWKWELPHDVVFTPESALTFVQRNSSEGCAGWRFYADVERTKPLGDSFSSRVSAGTSINIPCSNLASDLRTNIIYLYNPSVSSWPGMAELRFSNVYKTGEPSVSSTKALQYSEAQDTTYWIPSEATVSLDSVKASQSVGPVNDLYLTTTTGTPTASLSFSNNGAIAGITTKLPLKQKVYLNNETDKILGVQERPDELVITGGVTHHYKMVGTVAWLTGWIAEGFSSTQYLVPYLNIPQPTGTDVLEIFTRVKVPSSYSGNKAYFNRSDKDRGFYVQNSSKKFGFYDGNSHLSITATAGQTYWIGYTQDANKACTFAVMADDGTYSSVDELPSLSDPVWGTPTTWTSSEFTMVGDNVFYLGYNKTTGVDWGNGWIYLQDTVARVVSAEGTPTTLNWRATTVQNGVTVSGWSALYSDVTGFTGNTALDYTTPVSVDASSLEIPSGVETADLWYVNGGIKCKLPTDPVLDKAVFTGYTLVLDSGAISRAEKTGGLCAAFVQRGSSLSSRRYLLIASTSLNEGTSTVLVGSGSYNMSAQGTLPPVEVDASMGTVTYNRDNKTVVFEGNTFDYIGDMMCSLRG